MESADHEAARQAGHVLLDLVSLFDESDESAAAMDLATTRMGEVGAITATFDDETDVLTLDGSPLMAATVGLLNATLSAWADCIGLDRNDAIIAMREILDDNFTVE